MTIEELEAAFERHGAEYIKFERVKTKLHARPDMHAFLLLDKLVPGQRGMVAGATHDEIWLETDVYELSKVISNDDVRDLVRCGVRWGEDGLCMFA